MIKKVCLVVGRSFCYVVPWDLTYVVDEWWPKGTYHWKQVTYVYQEKRTRDATQVVGETPNFGWEADRSKSQRKAYAVSFTVISVVERQGRTVETGEDWLVWIIPVGLGHRNCPFCLYLALGWIMAGEILAWGWLGVMGSDWLVCVWKMCLQINWLTLGIS